MSGQNNSFDNVQCEEFYECEECGGRNFHYEDCLDDFSEDDG